MTCDLFNLCGRKLTNIAREGVLKGGTQMGYAKISLARYAKCFGTKSWRERVCIPHLSTQNRFGYSKFLPTSKALDLGLGGIVGVHSEFFLDES
jgi:hypothetical protein